MKNSVENGHSKKHMACREKYKALILKYVPYISKYMACIFYFSEHLKTNNLQKHKNKGSRAMENGENGGSMPHCFRHTPRRLFNLPLRKNHKAVRRNFHRHTVPAPP